MTKIKYIFSTLMIAVFTLLSTVQTQAASSTVSVKIEYSDEALIKKYLEIKDAHVASDAAKASENAKALVSIISNNDADEYKALKEAAKKIAGTGNLEEQRKYFEQLSEAMYTLAKEENAFEATLYQQYCPMAFNNKGAFWLSDKEEIRNPYFGDKMLKCGKVKETL